MNRRVFSVTTPSIRRGKRSTTRKAMHNKRRSMNLLRRNMKLSTGRAALYTTYLPVSTESQRNATRLEPSLPILPAQELEPFFISHLMWLDEITCRELCAYINTCNAVTRSRRRRKLQSDGCKRASRYTANNCMHADHKNRCFALLFVASDAWG